MPKRPSKSTAAQNLARNANPKGERLTAKHGKVAAHRATERRVSSKGRG